MNSPAQSSDRIRVLRIIARLNVGGPAIQAINLTRHLEPYGYETVLLRGRESPTEGSMDHLADDMGVKPVYLTGLRRDVGLHDLRALWHVMGWIWRFRPDIVHSHTAKAGALARLASMLLPKRRRPQVIVHTFHGHVFEGEFSSRVSKIIVCAERLLARCTTRVIAVSSEVADDLVSFGVAPAEKIETVRLGFDLSSFAVQGPVRDEVRRSTRDRLGIPRDALVVTLIARVVKVKRVDRFIDMARRLSAKRPDVWFLIAGDGDRRTEQESSAAARALGERLVWAGFQRDIPSICFASDVVALTSDNEGTPVCLIESQAAGIPVVTTRVGGVETVVQDRQTGRVVNSDAAELSDAVEDLLDDPNLREQYGARGREHSLTTFPIERLVEDMASLYRRLLREHGRRRTSANAGADPDACN
jgi:glycosyltransferase involved in cell wall biosynthesis